MLSSIFLLVSCTGIPKGLVVVENFDSEARDDGGIRVLNKGFDTNKQEWKSIEGKAYFNGPKDEGRLKVSFFGPFYGGYNIIKLEPDYSIALIAGPKRNYLWVLARDKEIPEAKLEEYIQQASNWGFATDELIRVKQ